MPIPFRCPHCGHQAQVADQYAGQTGPCSNCGQTVTIPYGGVPTAGSERSNTGLVIGLVIGVVVVLLLLCGGGLFWIFYQTRSATQQFATAVQQAQSAAQSAQQSGNLKELGLALHNYHDANNAFPEGTKGPEDLQPEQRLSWMAELLPYVEQPVLYDQLDFDQAWDAPANRGVTQVPIMQYQSGSFVASNQATIVGIGGLGVDAPTLPASDPRAGVFGYDRAVGFRHIVDGASNTMAVAESYSNNGPWAQGGAATVRGLDQNRQPYVGNGAQLGNGRGANVLLADGAVRTVRPGVDPKVVEALSTINGGEVVPQF